MNAQISNQNDCVKIRQGQYCGKLGNAHTAFKGVPYALSPTGERRFEAAGAMPDGNEKHDATKFGPACSQIAGRIRTGTGRADDKYSEDCLKLNVFTPAADSAHRPVMVWIHGGAFKLGSSNLYDGGHFAELGDVVVVSINYRLGIFGFVDIAGLTGAEVPTNLGLRDIIEALRWVRENIAAFGGDPDKVTIAGESAGSIAISILMHADEAQGLFHGAIIQSGAVNLIHDKEMAAKTVAAYQDVLGAKPTIKQLRSLSEKELLKLQKDTEHALDGGIPCSPWYDGDLLPGSLHEAHKKPTHPVRLMAGYNREETALFEKLPQFLDVPVARPFLKTQLNRDFEPNEAAQVISAYADDKLGTRLLATDLYFAMSMINMVERREGHAPNWFYRFDYKHWWLGAAHGLELLFLWNFKGLFAGLIRGGFLNGKKRVLADKLRRHWVGFIRDGNPGGDWSAYDADKRQVMLFSLESRVENDPFEKTRHAWNGKDLTPRAIE